MCANGHALRATSSRFSDWPSWPPCVEQSAGNVAQPDARRWRQARLCQRVRCQPHHRRRGSRVGGAKCCERRGLSSPLLRRGDPPTSAFALEKRKARHAPLKLLQEPPGQRVCLVAQQLHQHPSCELTPTQEAAPECEPQAARVACPPEEVRATSVSERGAAGRREVGRTSWHCVSASLLLLRCMDWQNTAASTTSHDCTPPIPYAKGGARRLLINRKTAGGGSLFLHGYFSVGARVGSSHA